MCSSDIFLACLAIIFPPIAVWVKVGICSADSIINILLCTLGWIPGTFHAWYIISLYPDTLEEEEGDVRGEEYAALIDAEEGGAGAGNRRHNRRRGFFGGRGTGPGPVQRGRVTYYYVNRGNGDASAGGNGEGEGRNPQGRPVVYGTLAGGLIPAQQPKARQEGMQAGANAQAAASSSAAGGSGANNQQGQGEVPPSYDQAVAGDHKVQT